MACCLDNGKLGKSRLWRYFGRNVAIHIWYVLICINILSFIQCHTDACDVGTVQNQSINGVPHAATVDGDTGYDGALSYLPGQRLSRCTCDGEDHPGPKHQDGTYVGRSAPEIDIFEAQINQDTYIAAVSQSAQWAVSIYSFICSISF